MKKILSYVVLASLLLISSCQKEVELVADKVNVTLSVGLPCAAVKSTSENDKVSLGEEVDILYYEVWNSDKTERLLPAEGEYLTADVIDNNASINVTLVRNMKYTFIFWAQNKDCGAYDVSDLSRVQIFYDRMKGNEDAYDAFYAVQPIHVEHKKKYDPIVLRRPFAQLNFGATTMDSDMGPVSIDSSYIKVSALSKVFMAFDGKGDPDECVTDVVFEAAGIVEDTEGKEGAYFTINNAVSPKYRWISMNYMLMPDENLVTINTVFKVTGVGYVTHDIPNVSLKKNHKTNIIGDLFTSDIIFDIIVDESFNEKDENLTINN